MNTPEGPLSPQNREGISELSYDYYNDLGSALVQLEYDYTSQTEIQSNLVLYRTLETLDMKVHAALHSAFMYQDIVDFDFNWYLEAREYVRNLSVVDLYCLKRYTRHGDVIINHYMRTPETFDTNTKVNTLWRRMNTENRPLAFPQFLYDYMQTAPPGTVPPPSQILTEDGELQSSETIRNLFQRYMDVTNQPGPRKTYIDHYIYTLTRILQSAPRPTKRTRVFRGIIHDFLRDSEDTHFQLKGFLSTTANPYIMNYFGRRNVHEIILEAGSLCIPMESISQYPTEMEILVYPDSWALPGQKTRKKILQSSLTDGFFAPQDLLNPLPVSEDETFYSRYVFLTTPFVEEVQTSAPENLNIGLGLGPAPENLNIGLGLGPAPENVTAIPSPGFENFQQGGSSKSKKMNRVSTTKRKARSKTAHSKAKTLKSIRSAMTTSKEPFSKVRDTSDPLYVKTVPPTTVQKRLQSMKDAYTYPIPHRK